MRLGSVEEAIQHLGKTGVVGLPTETVYGLAGRIDQPQALKRIFQTKRRPFFDPLIVHVSSSEMAAQLTTDWSDFAGVLAKNFWPGPLTMVLPKSDQVDPMITSGLTSVGLRMPKHPLALRLIQETGVALAAPSANRFGKTSPTTANHVLQEFPDEEGIVIDGGQCEVGLESTVLLIRKNAEKYILSILREGAISRDQILKVSGSFKVEFQNAVDKSLSPGHMKHHYMPEIPLVLVKGNAGTDEIRAFVLRELGKMPDQIEEIEIKKPQKIDHILEIPISDDPVIAARRFYSDLRDFSQKGADLLVIRISNILETSNEWAALRDRMLKAASLKMNF